MTGYRRATWLLPDLLNTVSKEPTLIALDIGFEAKLGSQATWHGGFTMTTSDGGIFSLSRKGTLEIVSLDVPRHTTYSHCDSNDEECLEAKVQSMIHHPEWYSTRSASSISGVDLAACLLFVLAATVL
jgi:hypothetical protein